MSVPFFVHQVDLAKRAGVGSATLQRLEKGGGPIRSVFIRVLTALGFMNDLSDVAMKKKFSIQEFNDLKIH